MGRRRFSPVHILSTGLITHRLHPVWSGVGYDRGSRVKEKIRFLSETDFFGGDKIRYHRGDNWADHRGAAFWYLRLVFNPLSEKPGNDKRPAVSDTHRRSFVKFNKQPQAMLMDEYSTSIDTVKKEPPFAKIEAGDANRTTSKRRFTHMNEKRLLHVYGKCKSLSRV